MDLPDLMALQQFRQNEGLMAPQYQGSTWRVHSLGGTQSNDSESARVSAEKSARQTAVPRKHQGAEAAGRVSVEHSSYVADRMWNIRAVMDMNNQCGTWGVGGAQRVGIEPGDDITMVDQYRISVPTRLQLCWGKFVLGEAVHEDGAESLALSSHLFKARRTGGGRGSAHYDWTHSPRFDSSPADNTPGRWEEASEAIKAAQGAVRDQHLLPSEPPLPPLRKWIPPRGWGEPQDTERRHELNEKQAGPQQNRPFINPAHEE